jgi:hypothetical protein
MSNNEERRVKARHEVTQTYQRRPIIKVASRRELPRADMIIEDNPNPARDEESSDDDDVEDDTYMPSPLAPLHGRGKGHASGSEAAEIQEEEEEEEETFDVEEITPTSYVHMGNLVFRQPLNTDFKAKVSYKGKTDLVREKRKENLRLVETKAGYDYRFHTAFQHDFYESVIIPKNKTSSSLLVD